MEKIITKEQVKKVAELSKLNLSEEEISRFSELFTDTLRYINVLEELDTSNVSETYQVTGLTNVFMENEKHKATLKQEEVLRNAKQTKRGLIVTKGVFDRG